MHVNSLWGELVADELANAGVEAAVLAPGSRSTPLTVALAERDDVEAFSHLDERSAAFFALGRAKRTGRPTPLVCTSGTVTAGTPAGAASASAFGSSGFRSGTFRWTGPGWAPVAVPTARETAVRSDRSFRAAGSGSGSVR